MSTTTPTNTLALLAILVGISGCAPVEDDAGGEGEGEGEPSCAEGRLRATSGADVDVDTCLTASELSEDGRELTFSLDDTFSLQIFSTVELDPLPLVLDETNASTIASYDDGTHVWRIAVGLIGGVPVGGASTSIESVDDDGAHGVFEGDAFDNGGEKLVDPMTMRVDF